MSPSGWTAGRSKKPEAYDLRPNLKDKPGSQGTLFQVKDKSLLNPERRWPRGYTPERQQQVQDALQDTVIMDTAASRERATPEQQEQGRYVRYPEAEARVRDILARSTVPVDSVRGLTRIHDTPAPGHLASYWPGRREIGIPIVTNGHPQRAQVEVNLLHELGHHVSNRTGAGRAAAEQHAWARMDNEPGPGWTWHDHDNTWYNEHGESRSPVTEASRLQDGVEEAFADDHAEEHYRPHPADRRRGIRSPADVQGTYDSRIAPHVIDRDYPGYYDVRPPGHLGPQFRQENLPG